MTRQDFIKQKIAFNHNTIGAIQMHTIDELPKGVTICKNANELILYSGKVKNDIIYFLKNIKGKYYIEITSDKTKEYELMKHARQGILFV